jgi:hypothetical protein
VVITKLKRFDVDLTTEILKSLAKYKNALQNAESLAKSRILDSEHPLYQSILFYKQRIQELKLQLEGV